MHTKNNIRLLVLPSWYPPRGGRFFRVHCKALALAGIDVTVLARITINIGKHGVKSYLTGKVCNQITTYPGMEPGSFTEIRNGQRFIPLLKKPNIMRWIHVMEKDVERWIRRNGKPDLIQAHSSAWAGVVAARIKQRFGIPYVVTEHRSPFVHNTPEARSWFLPWYTPLLKMAFSNADAIVTVSDSLQPKIKELLSLNGSYNQTKHDGNTDTDVLIPSMVTIPNMVDTEFFVPPENRMEPPPFVFFSLAHLEWVKGIDTLIESMSLLEKMHPGFCKLIIGGDGSKRKELEQQSASLGLHQIIRFTGALEREQVVQQLQRSHAFVLPSRFEAFGVVFIEAMACGLPVIAAKSGGPETFINEHCGTIVPPDDPEALAMAMKNICQNRENYDTQIIREMTTRTFGKETISRKYAELYMTIISLQSS